MVWIGKSTGNTDMMMCWLAGTPHAVIVLAATCVMCLCPVSNNYPFWFCINSISAKRKKIVNQINIFACVRRLCMSVGPAACSKCFVGRKGLVAEILLKSMINWVVSCLQQCKLSVDSSGNHASCANVASCCPQRCFHGSNFMVFLEAMEDTMLIEASPALVLKFELTWVTVTHACL